MDDGQDACVAPVGVRVEHLLRVDRASPGRVDPYDFRAAPAGDLAHAFAEHTVDADDRSVTRLEEIDEARFHAGRPGAADRQGQRVLGAEHESQPVGDLVEHREELGIEMPEHRPLERFHDLGIRVRRPRPEQQSIRMHHARRLARSRQPTPETLATVARVSSARRSFRGQLLRGFQRQAQLSRTTVARVSSARRSFRAQLLRGFPARRRQRLRIMQPRRGTPSGASRGRGCASRGRCRGGRRRPCRARVGRRRGRRA